MDATYIANNQFSVEGDQTAYFTVGRKVLMVISGSNYIATVASTTYPYSSTKTLVTIEETTCAAGLTSVAWGVPYWTSSGGNLGRHAASHKSGGDDIVSHGDLDGLSDDDHSQYLNTARHDLVARHPETVGGTGQSTYTKGDILYSDATDSLTKLGAGADGQILGISGGVPTWLSAIKGLAQCRLKRDSTTQLSLEKILANPGLVEVAGELVAADGKTLSNTANVISSAGADTGSGPIAQSWAISSVEDDGSGNARYVLSGSPDLSELTTSHYCAAVGCDDRLHITTRAQVLAVDDGNDKITLNVSFNAAGGAQGYVHWIEGIYYVYLSNSSASPFPSQLRLSKTAPTEGYLAASGNGANWRCVGMVHLDENGQFATDGDICSVLNPIISSKRVEGTSSVESWTTSTSYEHIINESIRILLPAGWYINIYCEWDYASSPSGYQASKFSINGQDSIYRYGYAYTTYHCRNIGDIFNFSDDSYIVVNLRPFSAIGSTVYTRYRSMIGTRFPK